MAKWITKANDDVLSFCECEHPLASLPGQLGCPWCGCSYLLTCSFCRKAFAYGKVITVDRTARELVVADRQRGGYDVDPESLDEDAEKIASMLEQFEEGTVIVYLDGFYLLPTERNVRLTGIFAEHDLLVLPQELARVGLAPLSETVGRTDYWLEREQTDRE